MRSKFNIAIDGCYSAINDILVCHGIEPEDRTEPKKVNVILVIVAGLVVLSSCAAPYF